MRGLTVIDETLERAESATVPGMAHWAGGANGGKCGDCRFFGYSYSKRDGQATCRYPEWLIERTNRHLIADWNTRSLQPGWLAREAIIEQAIADFYPAWERKPDFARFIATALAEAK